MSGHVNHSFAFAPILFHQFSRTTSCHFHSGDSKNIKTNVVIYLSRPARHRDNQWSLHRENQLSSRRVFGLSARNNDARTVFKISWSPTVPSRRRQLSQLADFLLSLRAFHAKRGRFQYTALQPPQVRAWNVYVRRRTPVNFTSAAAGLFKL
ncbi:hypothetical protein PYCCODRAFT_649531 [Trametes coccinea BRFM310]|uniref:Uncharacterized protein n=1 Tax=Trametes coccinea (strain BRFM310) TaxID=1353009 RepID=A0A1Y2IID4_TRAC3|nr:hypothetical protein PYCCODRAFT_649531 [Trametes coccinea BRFM310]